MAQRDLGGARRLLRKPGVSCDAAARPERQFETRFELEEGNGAILEFLADDALGAPAEAIAVERDGAFKVADAEGDKRDARLHAFSAAMLARRDNSFALGSAWPNEPSGMSPTGT